MKIRLYLKDEILTISPKEYIKRYGYFSFIRLLYKGGLILGKDSPRGFCDIAYIVTWSDRFYN